jgi:hypothetical protein
MKIPPFLINAHILLSKLLKKDLMQSRQKLGFFSIKLRAVTLSIFIKLEISV